MVARSGSRFDFTGSERHARARLGFAEAASHASSIGVRMSREEFLE
jgi:hypothetical protein